MTVSTSLQDHRAWVDVNLGHLVANARTIRSVARGASLLPMVKADAYGLGMEAVVRALEPLEPWGYGVATVDEAVPLRRLVVERPILVFTPAVPALLATYQEHDLRAVIDVPDVAAVWKTPFHLEIDTGMGRCGIRWDDAAAIAGCRSAKLEGVFTHLFAADEKPDTVDVQWKRFEQALNALPNRPELMHAANSAGVWRLQRRLDLVRPGIFLFGGFHGSDLPGPRLVASVRARIASLREAQAGDTVSYGGEWVAPEATRIATLGIGYADGIPRGIEKAGAHVLVAGKRRPIVGRVTMDFLMVALERGDKVDVGDVATLVGQDGSGCISVDEFAGWAGTISYELLARLGARLPRRYAAP